MGFGKFWTGLIVLIAISLGQVAFAQPVQPIEMATIERKPFAFQKNGEWQGFTIELWEKIATNANFETSFRKIDSFPELLSAVETGDVDLAGANISVTSAREEIMDFSQPIFDAGLSIMKRSGEETSVFAALFNPQLLMLLVGAILLFICAGALIAWCERKSGFFKELDKPKSLEEGIWWAVSVVTNASFTIFTPVSMAGRMLAYVLIVIGLFVVSAFVAQITASLTVESLRTQVSSIQDLRGKVVGTTEASTSSKFLTRKAVDHLTFESLTDLYEALRNKEIDAVVHDAPVLAYYVKTEALGEFETVGSVFNPQKYGFAFESGSPLLEQVNRELLLLQENGEYAQLVGKWFGANY
ncbi:amino acid ABC transporter substrate-binding protein [Amylibacter marinus]|uniref:Amino acid ABC transporter substrate-binding protein n=2 Tax=Amylibacter marinus TaxID=1475483 RepID=A0ABQ5VVB3_9RHOB|nr:amino acid ABC transporter substrate-binding protein [Amylibacter marinus]